MVTSGHGPAIPKRLGKVPRMAPDANAPAPPPYRLLTTKQVAERLACTTRYVTLLVSQGQLPAVHIGARALRISEADLEAFVTSRRYKRRGRRPAA